MNRSICATCKHALNCKANESDKFYDDLKLLADCKKYSKNPCKYAVMVKEISTGKYTKVFFSDELPEEPKKVRINYSEIVDLFKSICVDLSKPRALTDSRKAAIRNAKKQLDKLDVSFEEYFKKVQASDFLCRMAGRGTWKADIDFLMKSNSILQVLEGKYDNREEPNRDKRRVQGTPSFDTNQIMADAMTNTTIRGL